MTQVTPYPVRLPPELRDALQKAADAAGRKLQQEILLRLQKSIESDSDTANEQVDLANELQVIKRRLERLEAAQKK